MRYSRLIWDHRPGSEPVEILTEIDAEGWETRKIEIFSDGAMGFASDHEFSGGVSLAIAPFPADDLVSNEPELRVSSMTKGEFDAAWTRARAASKVAV